MLAICRVTLADLSGAGDIPCALEFCRALVSRLVCCHILYV